MSAIPFISISISIHQSKLLSTIAVIVAVSPRLWYAVAELLDPHFSKKTVNDLVGKQMLVDYF